MLIRQLEYELKVPLVRRGQKFEGLTPEGERLVHWARRVLADCDALKQEVTALLTDPFCAAHPLARVQLNTSLQSGEIVEQICRFELDAGIIYFEHQDMAPST